MNRQSHSVPLATSEGRFDQGYGASFQDWRPTDKPNLLGLAPAKLRLTGILRMAAAIKSNGHDV
jgi:hypothetical protein